MAAAAATTDARENVLVARAQTGDRDAFELLFHRYRDRIAAFVATSVRDDGRAEDLVQEIFFSAHSRLPTLEQPGAFRSWLYQIARNACLDEARRRSRHEELIQEWDEFPPPDERIVVHIQSPDRALVQKEELASLTQALDGLPQAQHDALVLRELEGRSYEEIGKRMRLSRPAVESVLFRARRGFKGEFVEITSGRRCKRMQAVMTAVTEGMGDLRERRKLIRHMRDCTRCRREAAALGLTGLAVPSDDRRGLERAFSRVAAFLPLPAFFGRRSGTPEQLSGAGSFTTQAQSAALQLSAVAGDHAVSAVHKAAAVVAVVAAVGGGGVAAQKAGVPLPVKIPVLDSIAPNAQHGKARGSAPTPAGPPRDASHNAQAGGSEAAGEAPAGATTHAQPAGAPAPAPPASSDPPAEARPEPQADPPAEGDAVTPGETGSAEPEPAPADTATTGGADSPAGDPAASDPGMLSAGSPPEDGSAGTIEPVPALPPPPSDPPSDPEPLADPGLVLP